MPGRDSRERCPVEIVEPGAPQVAVGEGEARRVDEVHADPEAGTQAQQRAGIGGDIGLVEGEFDGHGGWAAEHRVGKRVAEGGYSVAPLPCHGAALWTSSCDSAKRTYLTGR